jgi:hypothetical protein
MRDAMGYEYLIRKAFGCGRHGVAGADADTFRRYERVQALYEENLDAIKNNKPRTRNQSIEELANEAGVETGRVVAYINSALDHVKKHHYEQLTDEQYNELENCGVILLTPTKKNIEDVLEKTHTVFSDLGLQMR